MGPCIPNVYANSRTWWMPPLFPFSVLETADRPAGAPTMILPASAGPRCQAYDSVLLAYDSVLLETAEYRQHTNKFAINDNLYCY